MTGLAQQRAIEVFQKAMNHVFIEVAVVMGAGLLVGLLIRRHDLGDKVRSNQQVGTKKRTKRDSQDV